MRRAARTDANHAEIKDALRAVGAVTIDCHQLKNAFDILVGFRGELFVIEIKNPEYAPSNGELEKMLTSGERECKLKLESIGVRYNIVLTEDDALKAIGAI